MNIENLIYAYLAICVSMIIFNWICIFVFKHSENKVKSRSTEFESRIAEQIDQMNRGLQPDEKHKEYLCKKLNKVGNLTALDETIERLFKENPEAVKNYLSAIYPVFTYLAKKYEKKDEIQAAYFSYVIRRFGILKDRPFGIIVDTLFEMLHEHSLYCRENALQAIYSMGNCACVIRGLKIIDSGGQFHHSKLLTDGLLTFTGSHQELASELWKAFDDFSPQMKVTILNYFRFSDADCCEEIMRIMIDKKHEDDIRFSCIRYFGKRYYEPAIPILLDFAQSADEERWEYAAIASSVLGRYPSEKSIEILKNNLNNCNWYIRFNASESLEKFGLSYMDLTDVFDGGDRYAREILQYRLDQRKAKEKENNRGKVVSI